MPDRLTKDPVVGLVEALDRSRRWLTFLASVLVALVVAVVVLAFAVHDLSDYVKQPGGRDNRLAYQCAVERKLQLPEVDCHA